MMTRDALSRRQQRDQQWQRRFRPEGRLCAGGLLLLCCLCLSTLLSACTITNPFFTPSKSGPNPPSTETGTPVLVVSPTPTAVLPTITLKIVNCPSLPINWDSLVGTKHLVNKVQKVVCGSLEGAGTTQALVNVRSYAPDAKLDVYVYDNLTGTPNQRLKVTGLINGDAQIGPTGTVMTAETGLTSISTAIPDVFKEYQWNGSTFAQALFPAFYPDMTHYQAEQDQAIVSAEVAAGRTTDSWKMSGTAESDHLAQSIFHWPSTTKTVLKYDQSADTVIVQVTNLGPGGGGFIATFHHLDSNVNNIYEIYSLSPSDTNTVISSPVAGAQLSSPVSVKGISQASNGILGRVVLYDDTYINIGDSGPIHSSTTSGYAQFTTSARYQLNSHGVQEGVVAFYSTNQNNLSLTNEVVMVKVFISA